MSCRAAFAAITLLSLAACGSGPAPDNAATTNATGDYIERMQALNEKERNAVLFRAIRDAGRTCQSVERSVGSAPVQGKPAWVATCDDGTPWLVTLGNDGVATVTDARAVAGTRTG